MGTETYTRDITRSRNPGRFTRSNNQTVKNEAVPEMEHQDRSSHIDSISFRDSKFEVIYVDVDKIKPYRGQARTNFDEKELHLLAKTIKEHGVRDPLTLIVFDDHFEVVSGERRLRASKLAGLKKVPAILVKDEKKAEEIALIANIHRKDLHPIELGRAYYKLMVNQKESVSSLAERISVPVSQVSEYASYARIPQKVASMIMEHSLGRRAFLRELIKYDESEMESIVENEINLKNDMDNNFKSEFRQEYSKQDLSVENMDQNSITNDNYDPLHLPIKSSSILDKNKQKNLLSLKMKNGTVKTNLNALYECSDEDRFMIREELNKILSIIDAIDSK